MSSHHQQPSMEHLIERLRSAEGGGLPGLSRSFSRSSSRRSSWDSGGASNRGSIYNSSEESGGTDNGSMNNIIQPDQLGRCADDNASLQDQQEEEEEPVVIVTNVCSSCQAENQIRQALSVQQARQRSYLHGSVGPFQSLLGHSELKRTLPDGRLKVFIGTWNMNGKAPPARLEDLLLPTPLQSMPDLVVIGTQETNGERTEWEIGVQETLGSGHVLFHSVDLGTLHLAVFLRRDLIWVTSVPESSAYSTRAGSAFRTKGGTAIGFSLFGTSLLFINCHLTAHAEKVTERERDLRRIFTSLDLPKELPIRRKHRDVTTNYDVVFLLGDLNFRIDRPRQEVVDVVARLWPNRKDQAANQEQGRLFDNPELDQERKEHTVRLLKADQLKKCIQNNRWLKNFKEAEISFPPSYKYIPGSDEFDDSAKQRVPSYTDRILWRERKGDGVRWDHYDSVHELKSSDHFPVWGSFNVPIKPGRETMPLSAGTFNRNVYLEGMKRRVQAWDPKKSYTQNESNCTLQ